MARYVVEGPDGRRYIVEAPTAAASSPQRGGAMPTPAQGAQTASEGQKRPLSAALASYGRSAKAGVADAVIGSVLGVKQLFGGLSDDQKGVLEQMRLSQEEDENPWTRGGAEIATNFATLAIPGTAAEKAARTALKATTAARRAAAAATGAGATEFVTSVGEGDGYGEQLAGKAKNAALAAGTAGLLQRGGEVLAQPFRPSAEAQKLFDQGINPTLQQGAEGRVGRFVGGLAAGAMDITDRQQQEVAEALLRRVTDGNVSLPKGLGREYAAEAGDYVQGLYGDVMRGKKFPLAPSALKNAKAAAGKLNPRGQMERQGRQAVNAVENIIGPDDLNRVNRNIPYDTLRQDYLNPLAQRAAADMDPEVARRIRDARDVLINDVRNKRLTPEELQRITGEIDPKWYDVKRMQEATKSVAGEREGITLSKLGRAYGNAPRMAGNTTADDLVNPALRVIGETPRQEEARALKMAMNLVLAGGLGTTAAISGYGIPAAAVYGLSLAGQTAPGAKILMGQTNQQKQLADLLRNYVLGGTTSAAIVDEE